MYQTLNINLNIIIKVLINYNIFSSDKIVQDKIIQKCSFGGGCINDTIMHVIPQNLPFGGVGNSGIGSYHGKYNFKTFSHEKSILKKSKSFDIPIIYYPYNKLKLKLSRLFLR